MRPRRARRSRAARSGTLDPVSNPYAPPAAATFAMPDTPLPQGMRRVRLSPAPTRALVRRAILVRHGIVGIFYAVAILALAAVGLDTMLVVVVMVVIWLGSGALIFQRSGAAIAKQIAMFEVIASPRVVRRIMVGMRPAEVLRPEVTRIVETQRGLWLVCTAPKRTVALVKALDGYDALRAEMATWGTIEPLAGWAGFVFGYRQRRHMGARDVIDGTALASDPSLQTELSTVRAVSADRGAGYGPVVNARRRLVRVLILWALLVVMFLAIWQFLQPSERRPVPRVPPGVHPSPSVSPTVGAAPPLR